MDGYMVLDERLNPLDVDGVPICREHQLRMERAPGPYPWRCVFGAHHYDIGSSVQEVKEALTVISDEEEDTG